MRKIKLTIEYNGTNYCGWQVQAPSGRKKSIQEVIERALERIIHERVRISGSGRTDAGAHALGQVANFKTKSPIPCDKLQMALNTYLPKDIAIIKVREVSLDFHSRFDAKSKTYRYAILNRRHRSPLLEQRVYFYPYHLDAGLMRKESKCLLGRHDFKSFQAADKKDRTSIKTIRKIKIEKSGDLIYINIEADGFLYNMVRNIAGTLIEVGRGRFPVASMKKILRSRDRKEAGPTLPAHGLYLVKVRY